MAQDAASPMLPRPLKVSQEKQLEIPPFGAWGDTQCDSDSSLYDHLLTGSYRDTQILRTSSSGTETTLYKLPEEFAKTTAFMDFSVSPNGNVTVLVENHEGHSLTFDFDSEGKVSSNAQLEIPEQVAGEHIAVFSNGTRLFAGHYRRDAPSDLKGKRYVGLFQASGKLLKRLNEVDKETRTEEQAGHLPDGATTIGADGNIYLLTSDKVLIISASGTIQKKIAFTKPNPDFSAGRVQFSEGLLAISFAKIGKPETIFQYLVVNASTGEPFGLYVPTVETGNNNVCFTRHDGFVFRTVKNNRMDIITAPLR